MNDSHSDPSTNGIRIAWVTDQLHLGGTTTYLLNYARWLQTHGVHSSIFSYTAPTAEIAAQFSEAGLHLEPIPGKHLIFEDRMRYILQGIARHRPQAVIAHHRVEAFEILQNLPPGVQRIGIVHMDHPYGYAFVPQYAQALDVLISVSSALIEKVSVLLAPTSKVRHVLLPGAISLTPSNKRLFPLCPEKLSVLYVGRLDHDQKRAHLLPDIALQVKQAHIPARFTVVGDGAAIPDIREKIHRYQLEDTFTLLPAQNAAQVKELMLTHDVFLFPTAYEGPPFPLALLEAMSCGMAWVMSDIPTGIREEMAGKPSLLVPPDHIPGYAEAIIRLWHDHELGKTIGEEAQKIVREYYCLDALGPKWLELFKNPGSTSMLDPIWPASPSIHQPAFLTSPLHHPLLRPLRRLLAKFQSTR